MCLLILQVAKSTQCDTKDAKITALSRTLLELHIIGHQASASGYNSIYMIRLNVLLSMALEVITIHSIATYTNFMHIRIVFMLQARV